MVDISHAGVTVRDLEQSRWFYCDLLGLEVVRQYTSDTVIARLMWNAPGLEQVESIMLRVPDSSSEMQLVGATGSFGDRRDHLEANPWDTGAAFLSLRVTDIEASVNRLESNGFRSHAGKIVEGTQGARAGVLGALFTDPSGLFIELLQVPGSPVGSAMHTAVTASDMDRSVWFYRDGLGMDMQPGLNDDDMAFYSALWNAPGLNSISSAIFSLPDCAHRIEIVAVTGLPQRRLDGHLWDVGYPHVSYAVNDLDAVFSALAAGAIEPTALVRGMLDVWVAGSNVLDPDGFDLELLQLK